MVEPSNKLFSMRSARFTITKVPNVSCSCRNVSDVGERKGKEWI